MQQNLALLKENCADYTPTSIKPKSRSSRKRAGPHKSKFQFGKFWVPRQKNSKRNTTFMIALVNKARKFNYILLKKTHNTFKTLKKFG